MEQLHTGRTRFFYFWRSFFEYLLNVDVAREGGLIHTRVFGKTYTSKVFLRSSLFANKKSAFVLHAAVPYILHM